jgi:hypothetical protein
MLALAHGSKGIMFWHFSPNGSATTVKDCGVEQYMYYDGLVKEDLTPEDLYYYIRDGLSPRLKDKLGKTLLTLDYTGNYLQFIKTTQQSPPPPVSDDYLTLDESNQAYFEYNYHVGFLVDSNYTDSRYFLLANLYTEQPREVNIAVTNNFSNYNNMRFRNIEPQFNFDTTFVDEIDVDYTFPAGEGYLFQVAPVVKYGGAVIINDTLNTNETLIDDMIIRDGAELLNGKSYTLENTVKLEGTGFITGSGYIYLNGNGEIITSRWDRSLFKSKSGDNPHIFW